MISSSTALARLDGAQFTVVTFGTHVPADVSEGCSVTIVTFIAVKAVNLVDLLCQWVVGAKSTLIQFTFINDIVCLRRAVIPGGAFRCCSLTVRAEVARLAARAVSFLFC